MFVLIFFFSFRCVLIIKISNIYQTMEAVQLSFYTCGNKLLYEAGTKILIKEHCV